VKLRIWGLYQNLYTLSDLVFNIARVGDTLHEDQRTFMRLVFIMCTSCVLCKVRAEAEETVESVPACYSSVLRLAVLDAVKM
jgi:hypothetical protein